MTWRPKRFTRHPIADLPGHFQSSIGKVFVKRNDLVVLEGTEGKYYRVVSKRIGEKDSWWTPVVKLRYLELTLQALFHGTDKHGLIAVNPTGKTFKTTSGWQKICKPISQEVVDQVNAVLPSTLRLTLEGKLVKPKRTNNDGK